MAIAKGLSRSSGDTQYGRPGKHRYSIDASMPEWLENGELCGPKQSHSSGPGHPPSGRVRQVHWLHDRNSRRVVSRELSGSAPAASSQLWRSGIDWILRVPVLAMNKRPGEGLVRVRTSSHDLQNRRANQSDDTCNGNGKQNKLSTSVVVDAHG